MVKMESEDGDKLVQDVREFRARQHIPIGDPEKDVADFVKGYSPMNDRFPGREIKPVRTPERKEMLGQRVIEWLVGMIAKKPELMLASTAEERSNGCIGCPHNTPLDYGLVSDHIRDRGIQIRQKPIWAQDGKVNACRKYNIWLPAALFMGPEFLPTPLPDTPPQCFLIKPQ